MWGVGGVDCIATVFFLVLGGGWGCERAFLAAIDWHCDWDTEQRMGGGGREGAIESMLKILTVHLRLPAVYVRERGGGCLVGWLVR